MKSNTLPQLFIPLTFLLIFSSGCKKENTNPSSVKVSIGQTYQGGVVAYILKPDDTGYDSNVQHGLIVAPTDQSGYTFWHIGNNSSTLATGWKIGTGKSNTATIIASLGNSGNAASICTNLSLGGYKDWYLPSIAELDSVMQYVGANTNFTNELYWTSTEIDSSSAICQSVAQVGTGGLIGYSVCTNEAQHYVRAIRSF